ncbi:hypothetical protein [Nonomuraea sp. NPDC049784]|uniref:hypothetical protein n=1 Tax=Nonomuraea sp. NPDC049784 TaxID=3154361 RepID=UPI0033D1DF3F
MMNSTVVWCIAASVVCALALLVILNVGMPEPLRITLMIIDLVALLAFLGLLVAAAVGQRNG